MHMLYAHDEDSDDFSYNIRENGKFVANGQGLLYLVPNISIWERNHPYAPCESCENSFNPWILMLEDGMLFMKIAPKEKDDSQYGNFPNLKDTLFGKTLP